MRAKIIFFILFACVAQAKNENILETFVETDYAKQSTEVYKENSEWICKTEQFPYRPLKTKPYTEDRLNKLINRKFKDQTCKNKFKITVKQGQDFKFIHGCTDDIAFTAFIKDLNKNCGR